MKVQNARIVADAALCVSGVFSFLKPAGMRLRPVAMHLMSKPFQRDRIMNAGDVRMLENVMRDAAEDRLQWAPCL